MGVNRSFFFDKGCKCKRKGVNRFFFTFSLFGLGLEPGQGNSVQLAIKQQGWKNPNCLTPKRHEKGGHYHEGWYASMVPPVSGPTA